MTTNDRQLIQISADSRALIRAAIKRNPGWKAYAEARDCDLGTMTTREAIFDCCDALGIDVAETIGAPAATPAEPPENHHHLDIAAIALTGLVQGAARMAKIRGDVFHKSHPNVLWQRAQRIRTLAEALDRFVFEFADGVNGFELEQKEHTTFADVALAISRRMELHQLGLDAS